MGISKNHGGQGSHNKPIGCSASGVYAPGPDDEEMCMFCQPVCAACNNGFVFYSSES